MPIADPPLNGHSLVGGPSSAIGISNPSREARMLEGKGPKSWLKE
jgi:hypothetical protein